MNKLIYVAHPYGGKEENRRKIDKIMEELIFSDAENSYVSPIHNFGFVYLDGDEYQKGLDICLRLLDRCDLLVLCGEWKESRGCNGEFAYACTHGIPFMGLEQWQLYVKGRGKNEEYIG